MAGISQLLVSSLLEEQQPLSFALYRKIDIFCTWGLKHQHPVPSQGLMFLGLPGTVWLAQEGFGWQDLTGHNNGPYGIPGAEHAEESGA